MARRLSPVITLTAGAAIVGLALSACGSSSLSTPSASSAPVTSQAADPALVAKLPAKIKAAGKIVVGTDATYAPNEFLDADGKTVQGMDVDLFNAVAQKFGVKVVWQPASFDSIILGVDSGKYDIGVSSFTINPDRKKQVNMVSYFNAGTQWATAPGNPKKVDPPSPCGLKVAVQKGTVQAETDMPPKVKACAAAGKPIDLQIYGGQDQATAAVATGKADAMLADSPVVAYAIKQSAGKIEAAGAIYDAAPYGYVLKKADTAFAQAIADALKSLDTSGAYKKVLTTWGNEKGAISDFAVNPPVK
jgi:ABC-type amino acid transport/signal transduction systems, periplasmic component/domain